MKSKYSRSFSIGIVGILAILFIVWISSNSCGNSNVSEYKKSPPDTIATFIQFVTPLEWQPQYGISGNQGGFLSAWRLTKDTFIEKEIDSETKKKTWQRDSLYIIELHMQPKDTTHGKKDSLIYAPLLKKYVLHDFNKNPNKP